MYMHLKKHECILVDRVCALVILSKDAYSHTITLNLILPQALGCLTLTLRLLSANRLKFHGW